MNRLELKDRIRILNLLVEGSSMRSISHIAGVSINTATKLLVDAGHACIAYHDEHVRNITANCVQCDKIWSFRYSKQKNVPTRKQAEADDVWTWTALDSGNKLIISWFVGGRGSETVVEFINDLKTRLAHRIQLTTIEGNFGYKLIGAPHVEHRNLTMRLRMRMRRFTGLKTIFLKRIEHHCHALALYFMYHNFVRIHKSLGVTPAIAAGIAARRWNMEDIIRITNESETRKKSD